MGIQKREYHNDFSDWPSMLKDFGENVSEEPEYVFASYDLDGYDGSAGVIYAWKKDGPYYIVTGSHCSCYGLENQWDPTEHEAKDLAALFTRGKYTPYGFHNMRPELSAWLLTNFDIDISENKDE